MKKEDIYSLVTNRIIEKLNQGTIPWQRGYNSIAPCNFISKKPYRGINYWLTVSTNFQSPYYLTFKQAKELGGSIKKGESGLPIVFWQILKKEIVNGSGQKEIKQFAFLKYYTVFNAEQCVGIEFPKVETIVKDIKLLEGIIENMVDKPTILESHNYSPCYVPLLDEIRMPVKNSFDNSNRYYKTLFHELGHSTGASKRLNRVGISKFDKFGSIQYSMEELIAEMTASFAMSFAGVESETIDNSAAYIKSWISVLENDNKFIFKAAKEAELAWKYINNEIPMTTTESKAA
jgi:antirestriction protein ArdC